MPQCIAAVVALAGYGDTIDTERLTLGMGRPDFRQRGFRQVDLSLLAAGRQGSQRDAGSNGTATTLVSLPRRASPTVHSFTGTRV